MPKACIVYFSQSGNTEQVAERIIRGLKASGYRTALFNLFRAGHPPDIRGYDLIGIGMPVYYFRPPLIVYDYVCRLPDLKGVPFFVFITKGSNTGTAANRIRRLLTSKGGRDAGYFSSWGADRYLTYLQGGYLLSAGHPDREELRNAEKFGREAVRNAKNKKFRPLPFDPPVRGWIFYVAWFFTMNFFLRLVYHWFFHAKKKKCDGCGVCVKACPMRNILVNRRGLAQWGSRCIFCLYCEMKCPKGAVVSAMKFPLFDLLVKKFCLPAAMKNPALRYQKVNLRPGGLIRG